MSLSTENNKMKITCKQDLLQNIADALVEDNLPDNAQFYAEDIMPIGNIRIEIDEVGELSFPISDSCIEQLVNISTKAHFGSGEQTLLDENIRDTYEIASDKLYVSFKENSMNCMMDKMRSLFGFNDNCVLTPHLHNLLIYKTGQFFDVHQDSEKLENMIGTLVIVLPNAHIGGDLIINFGQKEHVFSSEAVKPVNAKCIAFYADCHHQVEKVKDGYRIALTYNLVLKAEELVLPSSANLKLCQAVQEYFGLKEDKQKLVYFLNHTYTEHGLKWSILKGEDRVNSFALCSAAKELSLVIHLALVEIKESWSAAYEDDLDDLIDKDITLSFWVDSDNKKVPFREYQVSESEICLNKDTDSFEPYQKQYEGYMGNYGNTMDYWYKRAAIVLWPESAKYSMNFTLAYDYSLEELYQLCKMPGNEMKVKEIVAQVQKYLCNSYPGLFSLSHDTNKEKSNILKLICLALYIDSPDTAISILSSLKWTILSDCNDFIKQFIDLQYKYGVEWYINLLMAMKANSLKLGLDNFDFLIQSFWKLKLDLSIVRLLLDIQFEDLTKRITQNRGTFLMNSKNTFSTRIERLHKFFKACLICEDFAVLSKMILNVISNTQQYPLSSLSEMYFELHENIQPKERVHFKDLRSYLTKSIDHKIISRMQSEDDWSINVQLACSCEICIIATSFLHSKTQKAKVWPLNERLRKHVAREFQNYKLPVNLTVDKTGSPYRLVLTKTDALHKDILKECTELKLCQQKLRTLNE